eukprot:TRINITY_DN22029_c0_g1_i1.p1 TRINITY_DN22029_c0_g1~~TRINITY_DN22029_c0_g1_i1.p1  ORF type:complete len:836 (+),score=250.96 TRINITY_DN22029_c0_g1_i1:90-2597(+)
MDDVPVGGGAMVGGGTQRGRGGEAFTVSFGGGPPEKKKGGGSRPNTPRQFLKRGEGQTAAAAAPSPREADSDKATSPSAGQPSKRTELRSAIQGFRKQNRLDKFSDAMVAVPAKPPPPPTAPSNPPSSARDYPSRVDDPPSASSAAGRGRGNHPPAPNGRTGTHDYSHEPEYLQEVDGRGGGGGGGHHSNPHNPPIDYESDDFEDDMRYTNTTARPTRGGAPARGPRDAPGRSAGNATSTSVDFNKYDDIDPAQTLHPRTKPPMNGGYGSAGRDIVDGRPMRRHRHDDDFSDDLGSREGAESDDDRDFRRGGYEGGRPRRSPRRERERDRTWEEAPQRPPSRGDGPLSHRERAREEQYGRMWEQKLQELDAVVSMYSRQADHLRKKEMSYERSREQADRKAQQELEERTADELKRLRKERQHLQDRCRALTAAQPQARKDREELEQLQDELALLKDEYGQKEHRYRTTIDRLQKQLKDAKGRNSQLAQSLKQAQMDKLQQEQRVQNAANQLSNAARQNRYVDDYGSDDGEDQYDEEEEREWDREREQHEREALEEEAQREREREERQRETEKREREVRAQRERDAAAAAAEEERERDRERERERERQRKRDLEREQKERQEREREAAAHRERELAAAAAAEDRKRQDEEDEAMRLQAERSQQPSAVPQQQLRFPTAAAAATAARRGHPAVTAADEEPEPEENIPGDTIVDLKEYADGKLERHYQSKKREVSYTNGTKKILLPTGHVILRFNNGDVRKTYPSGKVMYYYFQEKTRHTTHRDGVQIFDFEASQQVERHFPDGMKEISFPDGTFKYIYPDGEEESIFPDGTMQKGKAS